MNDRVRGMMAVTYMTGIVVRGHPHFQIRANTWKSTPDREDVYDQPDNF